MKFPQYRKYTFASGSRNEHTVYIKFTDETTAETIYVNGKSHSWIPGKTRQAPVGASSKAWDRWDGISDIPLQPVQQMKIYKIKEHNNA